MGGLAGGFGEGGMGASCVFKLSFEVKQGSCLLHLLRKIYLYLQYDASNTVRAQVTVMWVQTKKKKKKEDMGVGTRVRNELQHAGSMLQRHATRKVFCCTAKDEPVGENNV